MSSWRNLPQNVVAHDGNRATHAAARARKHNLRGAWTVERCVGRRPVGRSTSLLATQASDAGQGRCRRGVLLVCDRAGSTLIATASIPTAHVAGVWGPDAIATRVDVRPAC